MYQQVEYLRLKENERKDNSLPLLIKSYTVFPVSDSEMVRNITMRGVVMP